jgi:hypothetical protein
MSPAKAKFLETNSFMMYAGTAGSDEEEDEDTKRHNLARGESSMSVGDGRLWDEDKKIPQTNFEKQDYLVGPVARNQYWTLYKSDRKFKDELNSPKKQDKGQDPRFAYL